MDIKRNIIFHYLFLKYNYYNWLDKFFYPIGVRINYIINGIFILTLIFGLTILFVGISQKPENGSVKNAELSNNLTKEANIMLNRTWYNGNVKVYEFESVNITSLSGFFTSETVGFVSSSEPNKLYIKESSFHYQKGVIQHELMHVISITEMKIFRIIFMVLGILILSYTFKTINKLEDIDQLRFEYLLSAALITSGLILIQNGLGEVFAMSAKWFYFVMPKLTLDNWTYFFLNLNFMMIGTTITIQGLSIFKKLNPKNRIVEKEIKNGWYLY